MAKKTTTRTAMFDISTYPQHLIEECARERFAEPLLQDICQQFQSLGLIDAKGNITKSGWEILSDDCGTLERNSMRWLRQKFVSAVDHGHVDDALVGTVTFNPRSSTQRNLIEIGENERIDMTDSSYGDLAKTVMRGVSEFGEMVLGGGIQFKVDKD